MRVDVPEYKTFVDFPDDTPLETIQIVLSKNFPAKAAVQPRPETSGLLGQLKAAADAEISGTAAAQENFDIAGMDAFKALQRGALSGFMTVPELGAKLIGTAADQEKYRMARLGMADERTEAAAKYTLPGNVLLNMIEGGASLLPTLPVDILTGGIMKGVLQAPRVASSLSPLLRGVVERAPGFAFGMGAREALTEAADRGYDPLTRAARTVGGGLEGLTTGALFGKSMEVGESLPFLQRLLSQLGTQMPLGAGLAALQGVKESRLPSIEEIATGAGMGAGFGIFGALKAKTPKIDQAAKDFAYERDMFRTELSAKVREFAGERLSDAEADGFTRAFEANELNKAGIKTPTTADYRRGRENLQEMASAMERGFNRERGLNQLMPPGGLSEEWRLSNPIIAEALLKVAKEKGLPGPEGLDMGIGQDFTLTPSRGLAEMIIEAGRRRLPAGETPLIEGPPAPPVTSPYSPELAELLAMLKGTPALPPPPGQGEGFQFREPPVPSIRREREREFTEARPPESVEVDYKPRLTKGNMPFATEATAQAAITKLGLDNYRVVPVEGGYGIKRLGTDEEVSPPPKIVQPAPTSGAEIAKKAGMTAGKENIVTYLVAAGKVRLGEFKDLTGTAWDRAHGFRAKDRSREMGDIAAVSSKTGRLSMDEAADLINEAGFMSRDGKPWTSESLFNELASGNARKIFTPEKQDVMIEREIRRQENEWIERKLADLATSDGIDPAAVRKSKADIQRSISDEIRAEGHYPPEAEEAALKELDEFFRGVSEQRIDYNWFPVKAQPKTIGELRQRNAGRKYEPEPQPEFSRDSHEALGPEPRRRAAPENDAEIISAVQDKPWAWSVEDLIDIPPSKIAAKLEKIWGPEDKFNEWIEGTGPAKRRYWPLFDDAADLEYAIKNGDKAEIAEILKDIQKRLDPHDYYAYEEIRNTRGGNLRPVSETTPGAGEIPTPGGTGLPAESSGYLPGLSPAETFQLSVVPKQPVKRRPIIRSERPGSSYRLPIEQQFEQQGRLLEKPPVKTYTPIEKTPSTESGTMLYSGVDITKIPEVLRHLRDNIKSFRSVLPTNDITLLNRIWQSPHWLAKKHPEFKAIYDRQLKREKDRATLLDERLKGWESARNLSKPDLERLRKVIWITEGRKIKSVTEPRFVWKDNDLGRVGVKGEPLQVVKGLNLKHYRQIGEYLKGRGIPENVIDAYLNIRKHFDRSYAMILNKMVGMKDVEADTITKYRQEIGNIQNYFPHQWYGNYYFHGLDKDGNVVARIQYNDMAPMGYSAIHRSKLAQAKKEYPYVVTWTAPKKSRQLPEEIYEYPIPVEAMEQIIDAAAARVKEADPAAGDIFRKAMPEAVADVLKSRGFGSHMIRRKGVLGYEKQDILRVLHDFDSSFAGWLTKMDAARDFSTIMRDIPAAKKPNLYAYTSRYVKDVLANADRLDRIVDGMRAYFFLKYMGGVLKSGVVNLTQNIINGVPRLSIDTGRHAVEYFNAAGSDIVASITKNRNLRPDEARLIDYLYRAGVIQDQYAREVKGMIRGAGSQLLNGINNAAGIFMSLSEKFNRASLALAAFRLASEGKIINKKTLKKYGLEKSQKADYETAVRFAEDVTNDAHFVYGKGNIPEFLRGRMKIFRPIYSLGSFSHNLMQLWAHMLRQGGPGARAFALSMMATVLFGGMMSIPFARPLFDAWRKTFGTDPQKEIRDRFPEWVRDIVTYGVPAAVGVNVGGSLEIGNIDTGNPLKFIIGVPWSEGESVGRAAKAYKSGQPMRAIEEMAPSVVKNPMSAWRLFDQGQYSISGKPINLPGEIGPRKITALEAVGKAFGFQPVSSTKARDATDALNDLKEFVETKKTEWANRYVNAYNKNDLEAMGRVRQEVADWNERWMKQGQTEFTIILRDAVRNRLKPYQMPRRFRGISREYAEEYQ